MSGETGGDNSIASSSDGGMAFRIRSGELGSLCHEGDEGGPPTEWPWV